LVLMEAVRTVQSSSPLGEFLRRRLEQILARWEAGEGPAASAAGKAALWRFLAAVDELGAAVDGLLEPAGARSERAAGCRGILLGPEAGAAEIAMAARALAELGGPRDVHVAPGEGQEGSGEITDDPRSYPHLAGLLPRALERAIDFDVGAGVVARPGTEPLVDVYARSDCSDETLGRVREHALALFRLVAGGAARVEDAAVAAPPSPLRSALNVPLATDNRIVGRSEEHK